VIDIKRSFVPEDDERIHHERQTILGIDEPTLVRLDVRKIGRFGKGPLHRGGVPKFEDGNTIKISRVPE
jgi:hypothetical protein